MSYKLSRRLFVIAAVVCTLLRIVIHRACIDPSTGFYMGNRAFTMTYSFLINHKIRRFQSSLRYDSALYWEALAY